VVIAAATEHQDDAAGARSWRDLLREAAVPDEDRQDGRGRLRLRVPDPGRTATGMTTLMVARTLLGSGEKAETEFAGLVRSVRQNTTPDMSTQLAALTQRQSGRTPVVTVPELAVWAHNRRGAPGGQAVAIYPAEGTLSLDYPFTIVPDGTQRGADDVTRQAALLLNRHLRGAAAQDGFRATGLRGQDGKGAPSFGPGSGVAVHAPRPLPAPAPDRVRGVAQAWARLSLGSRMLSMIDISGSMAATVPGSKVTRLQAIAAVSQEGLALQPDDTELGQWVFSTELKGRQDWRENVSLGPLGERIGSATRRQLILSALASMRPKADGDTGLYDSLLAAFDHLTRTYKPEMINTVLLLTDGRNDDRDGPSLERTLERLRAAYDPERPVQIIMIGFGDGVDTAALRKIAGVTGGGVYVAERASDIRQIFRVAMARRLCAPDC
jgi:Mg-chelatase subunit ChlD